MPLSANNILDSKTNGPIPTGQMKILLVYPPTGKITDYNTPTGILYIASYLKREGYPVTFVDCSVEADHEAILLREVKDTKIVGVYSMSVDIRYLLPLLKKMKAANPDIKIVWGGPHATLFPDTTAKSPYADAVVRGEGEESMLEIVRGYQSGNVDLHKIMGINFSEGNKVYTNPDRPFLDMNTLPFIDWSFVRPEVMGTIRKSIIRVQTSRGCPYKCTFCINVVSKNARMRYRTPDHVLDEIEHLKKTYGITRVGFRDEIFLSNKEQALAIAQGLIKRNIKISWLANPRPEYLRGKYLSDDELKLLADSGCTKLQCGGESGSQNVLNFIKKGIKAEAIMNFVVRCKKFDIVPVVAFLIGIPTETEEDLMDTIRMIRDILEVYPKTIINGPANFRPYPGGELYDFCVEKYNLKMPQSLEEWASSDILGGVRPPWIKKIYLNQYLWTSTKVASYTSEFIIKLTNKTLLAKIALLALSKLSRFRLRNLNYKFPVEFLLLDWYHRFILRRVRDLS